MGLGGGPHRAHRGCPGASRGTRRPGVLHGVLCTCDKNLFHSDIDLYRELYYVRVCAAGERLYFFSGWRLVVCVEERIPAYPCSETAAEPSFSRRDLHHVICGHGQRTW